MRKLFSVIISLCLLLTSLCFCLSSCEAAPDIGSSNSSSNSSSTDSTDSGNSGSSSSSGDSSNSGDSETMTYTVRYDTGDNAEATLTVYKAQARYKETFPLPTPQYSGLLRFSGWFVADKYGKATNDKVTVNIYRWQKDVTLVAVWSDYSPIVS